MPILPPAAVNFEWQHIDGDALSVVFIRTTDDAESLDGTPEPFEAGTTGYGSIRAFASTTELVKLGPEGTAGIDGTILVVAGDADPYEAAQVICTVDAGVILGLDLPDRRGIFSIKLRPGGRAEDAYTFAIGTFKVPVAPTSGT